jgi:hypothetical protein
VTFDLYGQCCFCCNWLLADSELTRWSDAPFKMRAWVAPPSLSPLLKERFVKGLRRVLVDQLWVALESEVGELNF